MKFKKGDKVKILNNPPLTSEMHKFIGRTTYVTGLGDIFYNINCDNGRFIWNKRQLEKVED